MNDHTTFTPLSPNPSPSREKEAFVDILAAHPQWKPLICNALEAMNPNYLHEIMQEKTCIPATHQLFAAFSLPLSETKYILFGESPYPRKASANGFAFWDEAVGSLWSESGLSKEVNKATSLRNLLKTLLVARGDLHSDLSQAAISKLDKNSMIQTASDLFLRMMQQGILLLNASLVYSEGKVPYHARNWRPFMQKLLDQLVLVKPDIQLILFGKIAEAIPQSQLTIGLQAEHPYNVSFITNKQVLNFFNPLDLLANESI
ncbi:MAG: uracil-DNA glycosylase [Legionella sp.]